MITGYLQEKIIEIGKAKGFVILDDVKMFYSKNIEIEMNKLVAQGYFEKSIDLGYTLKWIYKRNKDEKIK